MFGRFLFDFSCFCCLLFEGRRVVAGADLQGSTQGHRSGGRTSRGFSSAAAAASSSSSFQPVDDEDPLFFKDDKTSRAGFYKHSTRGARSDHENPPEGHLLPILPLLHLLHLL